ncbi:rhomboid family intramembrane serine protease [Streptomyces tateyamensis]|uniref:Rhomboid family intramembrane serine protease n=1 Tax=Streptomyces tateyamensis TaxID=565073 RepID=A0A2V4NXE4_9ACTN|nr:rhomboid family intramembrane serine protease [Streptomyces tateyamensis]PYC66069.1 rhomboid family intramembrane serine protease [Streptomyces tateyamensis]
MSATPATPTTDGPHQPPVTTCYRHADRETYIRCSRCERFICPGCMLDAPVGYQCPECVHGGAQTVRQKTTVFGGRPRVTPVLTYLLIGLNVLAYLAELVSPRVVERFFLLGQGVMGPDGQLYQVNSSRLGSGFHLVGVANGEWYRLLTGAFLHQPPTSGTFGITHILFNMYSLWLFGRVVEAQLGRVRFLTVYLLSALGGSVLAYQLAPNEPSLGASGAIFGLVGAYFLMTRRSSYDPLGGAQQLVYSLVWLVVSAGITSWQGHLGGLLAGSAVGAAMVFAPRNGRAVVQALGSAAVLALLVVLVLAKNAELANVVPVTWLPDQGS